MQHIKDPQLLNRIGERIRSIRKQQNLSQARLAGMMNNHAEHLGRIERGEINVTITTLQHIATCLKIDLSELVKGAENSSI